MIAVGGVKGSLLVSHMALLLLGTDPAEAIIGTGKLLPS
jgi:hypothetical protein